MTNKLWAIKCKDGSLLTSQKRPRLYISEHAAQSFAATLVYNGAPVSPTRVIEVKIVEVK